MMSEMSKAAALFLVVIVALLLSCNGPDKIVIKGECLIDEQCQSDTRNITYRCGDDFRCKPYSCESDADCVAVADDETYYCETKSDACKEDHVTCTNACMPFKCEADSDCQDRFGSSSYFCESTTKTCDRISTKEML